MASQEAEQIAAAEQVTDAEPPAMPASSSCTAPIISQLVSKLKPPLLLVDAAWIPTFRQTCYPPEEHYEKITSSTSTPAPAPAPQPISWQEHLSTAPPQSFASSFTELLAPRRPSLVFFGEQHHQPNVIRAQIQLLAALADQKDQLNQDISSKQQHKRTIHHLHLLLEHFSYADQPLLDRFHAGSLSITELCSAYKERSNEGFKIEMYAPLLLLARERGATIWGGFPPRQWAKDMMKEGVDKVKASENQRTRDTQADPTRAYAPMSPSGQQEGDQLSPGQRSPAATTPSPTPGPLPVLDAVNRLTIPPFASWKAVQHLSSSHRTFLSSLMKPDGPPRFPPPSTASNLPLGAISALHLYPTHSIAAPKEESKGFSPAQALKDSYLAHAASVLVDQGHLLAKTTTSDDLSGDAEGCEVEHRNIVLVIAGLGHVEAGFGAPERLAGHVSGDSRDPEKRPLIILSKPNDSSLWLGPEWDRPTSSEVDPSATLPANEPQHDKPITQEWLREQVLAPSAGQVAGHEGAVATLTGPNGERLVAKKSIASEAHFYRELNSLTLLPGESEAAARRRKELAQKFTPTFYGSFPLPVDKDDGESKKKKKEQVSLVVEDLLAPFRRPNVMDIKLGTQLWDESSSEEKKQRMDKVSRETTSGATGVRLTGWRTWNPSTQEYQVIPKVFGKTIKPEDLIVGMKAFFGQLLPSLSSSSSSAPSPSSSSKISATSETNEEESIATSTTREREREREKLQSRSIDVESFERLLSKCSLPTSSPPAIFPSPLIQQLLAEHLLPQVEQLTSLLSSPLQTRMRGASLLVVWEGDLQQLEESLNNSSSSSSSYLEKRELKALPLRIHLIDFAHSKFVFPKSQGKPQAQAEAEDEGGEDKGVIQGLKTIRSLVEEMVIVVHPSSSSSSSPSSSSSEKPKLFTSKSAQPKKEKDKEEEKEEKEIDQGWNRKLADGILVYDWID